jgi:hypothetical protein
VSTPKAIYDGTWHCAVLKETKERLVSANTCPRAGGKVKTFLPPHCTEPHIARKQYVTILILTITPQGGSTWLLSR